MEDARLATALVAAAETERAVKFWLDTAAGEPLDQARGWAVYRNAVGLRKALEMWTETRRWRAAQAADVSTI